MSWRSLRRGLYGPVTVENTVPPADIVPGFGRDQVVVDTPEAAQLEQQARVAAVTRLVHRTLLTESLKDPALRNPALVDLCLEVRSALQPAPADAEVLREVPPVGVRYPVPVVPGVGSFRGYVL